MSKFDNRKPGTTETPVDSGAGVRASNEPTSELDFSSFPADRSNYLAELNSPKTSSVNLSPDNSSNTTAVSNLPTATQLLENPAAMQTIASVYSSKMGEEMARWEREESGFHKLPEDMKALWREDV